jgi:transcriptional regulator with XRE-family HTH domain
MSRLVHTRHIANRAERLGSHLRRLREERALPQRIPASAAQIDSTLLSKIELGERAPTQTQLAALAAFYRVAVRPLEARRLAEEMLRLHGDNPAFAEATAIIREEATGEYRAKKLSAAVNKPPAAVNKPKKNK